MSADDHGDGLGGQHGRHDAVHGLLATAFTDDMPVLNLVPAAVDGYRRHRRRARVLGSAGGALALVGVIAAGVTLGAGGRRPGQNVGAEPGPGTVVPPKIAAKCAGTYNLLGGSAAPGVYSSDQQGLTAVCEQDLATLQQLTGDTGLVPLTESYPSSTSSEPTSEMTPQIGGPDARIQPGDYLGSLKGTAYNLEISVYDKITSFGTNCTAKACPPTDRLADGHLTTTVTGPRDTSVVVHYDATHSVLVRAGLKDRNSEAPLPFDVEKLLSSPAFARLISYDVHTLDKLPHPG
ncbi:hypothetical protein ABH920_000082 [Catenulispora sp. EB89]|uniref:hypothetical protein n=1 Tax=Catenulispora sp. EB89 TaxID=3156257 RepID=UPI00351402E2